MHFSGTLPVSMARLPTVAIIGRPNTGKSTLFNRFVGRRRAIVSDTPGTTRDHVSHRIETEKMDFLLLDTGGIGGGSEDKVFEDDVSAQSLVALAAADLILFTVNSQEELTSSDNMIVDHLRKKRRKHVPVILVATKCDNEKIVENALNEYLALGISDAIVPISAVHNSGVSELEDAIVEELQKLHFKKEAREVNVDIPRIAIIGKPNVGKSSIVNALMSDPQRELSPRLVSEIPGTTRDSSDSIITYEGKEYVFVDTAGLRRKARVEEDLEYLGNVKSIQAMEDADIIVLTLDATDVVSKQDKRIASMAVESGKALIFLINKADKLTGEEKKEKEGEIRVSFQFCRFAPILFVSAVTREGLLKMFLLIESVQRNRMRRIPTKELLRWYETAIRRVPSSNIASSKFITQADEIPPTFVLFVRDPKKIEVSQLRFLENSLRETFAFEGTPLRWITKSKGKDPV